MSPRAPLKLTLAPCRNRRPVSVNATTAPWLPLVGSTADNTGFVTLNGTPLLNTPLTATVTLPPAACDGTVTVSWVVVAATTVAAMRPPLVLANVTELLVAVALKPDPLTRMLLPSAAAFGVRVEMAGGGGGGGGG